MKIMFYFLRPFDELAYAEKFSREYGIEFAWTSKYADLENVYLAEGCDAVCTTPCDMSAPMVEAFAKIGVKYLPCRSIGYDHIDLSKAKAMGMKVSNASYAPAGVANYAVMMMLMSLRKMLPIMKRADIQDFSLEGKMGRDISNCTVGVIGTGRIGTTVIKSLSGFGCRILCYDQYENAEAQKHAQYTDLETLLAESDIITLHINATPDNTHIIDKRALSRCKDGVIIVNTARGALVDTDALIEGIESGRVGAAALDVLEHENGLYYYNLEDTIVKNNRLAILRSYPNVICSPHTAFYTEDAVESMVRSAFESCKCYAEGKENPYNIPL